VSAPIEFVVPGEARGWARARLGRSANGKPIHFMDRQTRSFESLVKMIGAQAMAGRPPLEGGVVMELTVRRAPPASTSRAKLAQMVADLLRPSTKPDASNVAKGVEDALNGVCYRDDAQIVRLVVDKVFSLTPGVDVRISRFQPEQA
jgi:Holliday junction resolvase RusA-like endonuclease